MANPGQIAARVGYRAGRIPELVSEARRINPPDAASGLWEQIADGAARADAIGDPIPDSVPVTLRQVASRWYENVPGGFDAAVANSQRALREHGIVYPNANSPAYGMWSPQDVDKKTPARIDWGLGAFGSRGTYSNDKVLLNSVLLDAAPKGRNPTIEHEVTHAMLDKTRPTGALREQHWRNGFSRFDDTPSGYVALKQNTALADQYNAGGEAGLEAERRLRPLVESEDYLMQRAELDPRIAEVRRRYAFYTGRDVVTPEDAADAWEWWRTNREWLEDLSTPTDTPSMMRSHFDTYDALPDSSKSIMFRRMTQVPAVMAPIGLGASGEQERPHLLDGLNRR